MGENAFLAPKLLIATAGVVGGAALDVEAADSTADVRALLTAVLVGCRHCFFLFFLKGRSSSLQQSEVF